MADNLLNNGDFEADWSEEGSHRCLVYPTQGEPYQMERGNVFTPPGWITWFRHGGPVEHDAANQDGWCQPEVRDAWITGDPVRVHSGQKGILFFTFWRIHDGGFLQRVRVEPGTCLRLSAWAHAWSSQSDDPRHSEGAGTSPFFALEGEVQDDGARNFTFWVGIDPTGGTNPYADTVVWGRGAHIYNAYAKVPSVEAVSAAETVTVFLRSRTLWRFKHNDAYWDDAELTVVEGPPPNDPSGGHTKMGPHVLRQANDLLDYIRARPAVVKLVGEWGLARQVPEGVLVVGRRWEGGYDAQQQYVQGQTPRRAAERFVQDQLEVYLSNPSIKYWEGHNEPVWSDTEGMAWYAQFEIERMKLMARLGLKCVIGNFATGTPPLELWPAFLPAIRAGLEYEAILGLHEYSYPWMWWMTGKYQIDPNEDQGDEGWTTLRYRKVYRQHLIPNDLVIPLVITECAIGVVHPAPPGVPLTTWNGLGEYWRTHHEGPVDYSPDNAEYYFRQLVWYDRELCKDDYVVGMTVFTWGNWGGAWKDFDVAETPVAGKLVQYTRDNPAEPFDYARHTGRDVKRPEFVPPRIPYKRTYVLLPQITDAVERLSWRVAAAIGSSEQMRTVGHSADDAGVGPQEREIVAVNPGEWGSALEAWYDEHYPGAEFRAISTHSPWEMAINLLPALDDDIALAQADPRWADCDFGEHPSNPADGGTIGRAGGFLVGLTIILRKLYQRDVTPPVLDKLLVAARAAYVEDAVLDWPGAVDLFPVFDDAIKDNDEHPASELAQLLGEGWEIILRRADGGHFVYLEDVAGDILHIIDTWDGARREKPASDYRGIRAAHIRSQDAPCLPEANGMSHSVPPRVSYRRSYVLLPQIEDTLERLDWRVAAAIGSSAQMRTVGHSADDAGVGPQERDIIAVNPAAWGGDLKGWYDEYYPNAKYSTISTDSPWEMAIKLLPVLDKDIALAQTSPRWAGYDFGEHPDNPASGETIGNYGCFLTGLAIILRRLYHRDITPPMLDALLVAARAAYVRDNLLDWPGAVALFPIFNDSIKDNRQRSVRELERLLRDGWEIVLRRADGGHFVYLEDVRGDALCIIDTWDGKRKLKPAAEYAGLRAAHIKPQGPPPAPSKILVGLHDRGGGEWMLREGVTGCCLVHHVVQQAPIAIDYRALQDAGIAVIARLNWGYADGTGTLPRPVNKDAFISAVAETILAARGVDYFHVGNEPNNRQEWPGFGTDDEFALTADYVVDIYNKIWQRVGGQAKIGPPPLDPYFGPGSNNQDWWIYFLDNVAGADALFLHAKTQTNDPTEIRSKERFTDDPLTWQYLHLRTVETALAIVPDRFCSLPVFVTELNPQHLDRIGGAIGWRADNAGWVRAALRYFREERPVTGVVFYRYDPAGDQAPFGLADKPVLLNAIKDEASL